MCYKKSKESRNIRIRMHRQCIEKKMKGRERRFFEDEEGWVAAKGEGGS